MEEIPNLLLFEILQKLPLKDIFRLKSVSKLWLSIISDPLFARSYKNKFKNCPLPWVVLSTSQYIGLRERALNRHPQIVYTKSLIQTLAPAIRLEGADSLKLVSSSNGLLLFCTLRKLQVLHHYVCCPFTLKWVRLPKPLSQPFWYKEGLVVEEESGKFLVVRLAEWKSKSFDVEIFSSESGKWRCLQFYCPEVKAVLQTRQTVYFEGRFYWLINCVTILTFDPKSNATKLGVLKYPDNQRDTLLGVLGISCGLLRLMEMNDRLTDGTIQNTLTVWLLKDYNASEWLLEYDIGLSEFGLEENYKQVLAFHPFDYDVVYLESQQHLFCCNLSTRTAEVIDREGYSGEPLNEFEAFPFVLPSWPTQLPQPSWDDNT